jgi:hypothetical protein
MDSKVGSWLQVLTTYNSLTIMFRASLQSYFRIVTSRMKRSTLQQHKEVVMLCEEGMTNVEIRSALLIPQGTKLATPMKT